MDILRVKINGEWTDIPAIVGPDGTTFIPSVDSQGNLSWSNTGGQPNPPTVNIKGPQGQAGRDGATGQTGAAGTTFIPYVASNGDISWSNADGKPNPATVNIKGPAGTNGSNGQDGVSPVVTVTNITGGHRVTITDAEHPNGQAIDVMDGSDGQTGPSGADGYSPTASATKSGSTATITITDKNGTTTATVSDGQNGTDGQQGPAGPGVASGGTQGQMLVKASGTDYDTEWANQPSVPVQDVQVNGSSIVQNGVANVPIADSNNLGAVKVGGTMQIGSSGEINFRAVEGSEVKAGTTYQRALTPERQHASVFYGLAKAAGDTTQSASSNQIGTYTEAAKSAISQMLNAPVTVTGTTPTINAQAGVRYVCGEVATITINPPVSGCTDVVFSSGTTAAVLTVPNTVKWPAWFDATNLDANAVYEINIMDGIYGAVGVWT